MRNRLPSSRGSAVNDTSLSRGRFDRFRPGALYDADKGTTVVTGVSQWLDGSGNANTLTQGTGSAQPALIATAIRAHSALRWDGLSHVLAFATTVARAHVFAVLKQVAAADQPWLSHGDTTNGFTCAWLSGVVKFNQYVATVNAGNGQTCSATSDTSYHAIDLNGFATSASANVVYYDGVNKDTAVDGTGGYGPNGKALGSNGAAAFANIELTTLALFTQSRSASERRRMERFMGAKYGLAVT